MTSNKIRCISKSSRKLEVSSTTQSYLARTYSLNSVTIIIKQVALINLCSPSFNPSLRLSFQVSQVFSQYSWLKSTIQFSCNRSWTPSLVFWLPSKRRQEPQRALSPAFIRANFSTFSLPILKCPRSELTTTAAMNKKSKMVISILLWTNQK